MIVDLTKLDKSPHDFEISVAPEEIDLESEGARLTGPVRAAGRLTKAIAHTEVSGQITADVEVECTRCLKPARRNLDIPFDAVFVTEENYTAAKEAELNQKDLDVSIFDGESVDLTELVREQIVLNLPTQVFCKEDCQGLCQKCGADLNLENCSCREEETDPRWSALKNLK